MKRIALILASLALMAVLASCGEKCTTCSYTYDDANGDSQTETDGEYCGNKSLVKLYKEGYESTAELEAQSVDGTNVKSSCVDN